MLSAPEEPVDEAGMSLSRVAGEDELYIGGIFTLNRRSALERANITHIVSVLRYDFKEFTDWERFQHCSVQVDDVEDENLLGEFARTSKFIKDGLQSGGGVLVHCAMGKSRSVTIVLAYLLSTRPQTCPDIPTALALVRETRPHAEPNSGFMAQLELYRAMGYTSDVDSHPMYQRWLYQQEVQMSLAVGRAPDRLRFEDEEEGSIREIETGGVNNGEQAKGKELRCRKCRRTLATEQYLIPHNPKSAPERDQETATSPIASLPSSAVEPQTCTHHFIHPLSWMRATLSEGQLSGRLECPNAKCGQQVGRYAWQGLRCSCGHWITPGFSLAGGKVDEVLSRPSGAPVTGVRMPPGREKGSL